MEPGTRMQSAFHPFLCSRTHDAREKPPQLELSKGSQGEGRSKGQLERDVILQGGANIDALGVFLDRFVWDDVNAARLEELVVTGRVNFIPSFIHSIAIGTYLSAQNQQSNKQGQWLGKGANC